jgi:hypothetical protein
MHIVAMRAGVLRVCACCYIFLLHEKLSSARRNVSWEPSLRVVAERRRCAILAALLAQCAQADPVRRRWRVVTEDDVFAERIDTAVGVPFWTPIHVKNARLIV